MDPLDGTPRKRQAEVLLLTTIMASHQDVTLEALYELHKEWNCLVAHRDAIRSRPYDDDAEQDLIARLEQHRVKLASVREAILRKSPAITDVRPSGRRTDRLRHYA